MFENVGSIPAYILVQQYVGPTTLPSGYSPVAPNESQCSPPYTAMSFVTIGTPIIVQPKGVVTRSYALLSQRVGFFGSGIPTAVTGIINGVFYNNVTMHSTMVNITAVLRNPSDLRGAQIDISQVGRQGWGYDAAFNTPNLTKQWGSVNSTTGIVNPAGANYNEPLPT